MRYYVIAVQYNRVAEAENRTVPKAYDTFDDAVAEWHRQMANDMKNDTLGWSLCIVLDSNGKMLQREKWTRPVEVVEEVPEEE